MLLQAYTLIMNIIIIQLTTEVESLCGISGVEKTVTWEVVYTLVVDVAVKVDPTPNGCIGCSSVVTVTA